MCRFPTILTFLKAPRIGYVKTRLAQNTSPEFALETYRKLVERQLSQLPKEYPLEIHFTPDDALSEMNDWLGNTYNFYPQCSGRLGIRLENAVADAFARGAHRVICIGGDCPQLNHPHFEQTATALENDYDVVYGPSEDGGYYLIGLNTLHPELFQDIPWSSPTTLNVSLKRAEALDLRVKLLGTLYDVDTIVDLERAISHGLLPDMKLLKQDRYFAN